MITDYQKAQFPESLFGETPYTEWKQHWPWKPALPLATERVRF